MVKINKKEIPKKALEVIKKLKDANFEAYIVGGAVRDLVLKRPTKDWDFTTNANPDEILSLFPDSFYNNSFGTVGIPVEGYPPFEITTYRTENNYEDFRRPKDISWGRSLLEDTTRRDFTINAMAIDIENGEVLVIDYFDGLKDLEKRLIKTVGDPKSRFGEDALRMMRAIRIACEINFQIEPATKEAICHNSKLLVHISSERVKDELWKILASPKSAEGIRLMKETGVLDVVLPELSQAFSVDQKSPNRHHIDDVGTHLVKSLEQSKSTDPLTRFAILIHDIGKPKTVRVLESGVVTFYNHEVVGAKIAMQIADRLKLSRAEREKLFKLVRWHQFTVDERQTDSAIRRFIRNVGVENIEEMLALRIADRLGGGAKETSWRLEEFKKRLVEVQKQPFSIRDLKINGNQIMDILQIEPGPTIGRILARLFSEVEEGLLANEKEALAKRASELYEEGGL